MTTETRLMTAEELQRLPEDHQRYELVGGVLTTMPPNSYAHGLVAANLCVELGGYIETNKLGTTLATCGYILRRDPDTVRAADISFIRQDRWARLTDTTGYPSFAPDLAVDIIDPWDGYTDVMQRRADWLTAGTRLVLVIDPSRRTVAVHRSANTMTMLTEDDQIDGADAVPGWTMSVRALFE